MKNAFATRIASAASAAFAAVAIASGTSTLLLAQQPAPGPPSGSKPTFYPQPSGADLDRMERDRHFRDLEMIEKVISKEKAKPNQRDREMALRQATEDFQRLLDINQETLTSAGAALDYKRVFETTAEIQKRSTRLKSNLLLPVIVPDREKKLPNEMDDSYLSASVSALRQLITNFVTNPVFYGDGSIDAKLQAQAARDLDGVIELSGRINKRAEKLEKSPGKSK
ncbi:MAG: hypothetical protein AABN33_28660 [Acidobacteriota bacterium]